ncbi:MAG: sodium:calcium antiporter [Planctomycetes bacterium]|nr:sodium:calcium antiporter [Planctomycetota bacterium]
MEYVLIAVQLAFGVLGLHFGANWLVSGSSKLALTFGIKPLIIGLTVVAMGTSAPELTVSLGGAFQGKTDLAVGNVVGSNIANIGLILGLSAAIRPMKIQIEPLKRDLPFMLFAALLLAGLPFIGGPVETENGVAFMMDRWKGGVLLGAMALFMWLAFRGRARRRRRRNAGKTQGPRHVHRADAGRPGRAVDRRHTVRGWRRKFREVTGHSGARDRADGSRRRHQPA